MKQYQWKEGIPQPKIDANDFGAAVEAIEAMKGVVKTDDIVAIAKDPNSPIHAGFNWDDTSAAHEHRKEQARKLLGGLQLVRVKVESNTQPNQRAYHVVKPEGSARGYVSRERVVNSDHLRKQLIESARRELEGFLRRFESIAAMGKYIPQLREIVDQMRDDADRAVVDATRRSDAPAGYSVDRKETAPAE